MEYQNKKLICRDCQQEFIWSKGEQEFFAKKGLQNPPTRCPRCREEFKRKKAAGELEAQIICSQCGSQDRVPFAPRNPKEVLCERCFQKLLLEKSS